MDLKEAQEKNKTPYLKYGVVIFVILIAMVLVTLMPDEEPEATRKNSQDVMPSKPVIIEPVIEEALATTEMDKTIPEEAELPVMPEVESVILEAEPDAVEPEIEPEPTVEINDAWLTSQLVNMIPDKMLTNLLITDELISNFVVFVDNASRGQIVMQFSPVKAPNEKFIANEDVDNQLSFTLNTDSYKRYQSYAALIGALPTEKSLAVYNELQPAIKEAYLQLGYAEDDFDRKLVRAIGLLTDTPIIRDEIKLIAPSAMFKYADEELEALLPIQKLFMRMGPEQQESISNKLNELVSALQN